MGLPSFFFFVFDDSAFDDLVFDDVMSDDFAFDAPPNEPSAADSRERSDGPASRLDGPASECDRNASGRRFDRPASECNRPASRSGEPASGPGGFALFLALLKGGFVAFGGGSVARRLGATCGF